MTVQEANTLHKGDYVFYDGEKYKVLHVKELRRADTNEVYVSVKCQNKNRIIWLPNDLTEV